MLVTSMNDEKDVIKIDDPSSPFAGWKFRIKDGLPKDDFCYWLIEQLFDVQPLLLTEHSLLDDFVSIDELVYPEHQLTCYADIPKEDRHLYHPITEACKQLARQSTSDIISQDYESIENQDTRQNGKIKSKCIEHFWYPPFSEEELAEIDDKIRAYCEGLIKTTLGITLDDYPEEQPLYVWKIAEYIKTKLQTSI